MEMMALQEWKQKGNTIGHTLPFGFCLVEFKKVVGLRTENGNPERRSSVFLMESQRGWEVGLGFFWCLGHCQCQRKWACGAGLRSVTIKGSGMPLCRNLRSCPTVTVNLLQMRRVSKTYFLLETVQQRPYAWVGRCYRHLQAWTERPEGCRRADAEEMETNREDSWFGAQHHLPCPDYWLRSQNVPFRKLPLC